MAIDPSIALQVRGIQIDRPLEMAKGAMTMSQLAQQAQLQDRAIAEDQAIRQAFSQGMGPDGRIDRKTTMSALVKASPMKAMEVQKQWTAQDQADQELQRKNFQDQLNFVGRAATSSVTWGQPQYEQFIGTAQKLGLDTSMYPPQWGPDAKKKLEFYGGLALTQLDQLTLQEKRANIGKTQAETARIQAEARVKGPEYGLTEAEKAVDKDYAKQYNSFTSKGRVNSTKAIERLEAIASEMEQNSGFGEAGGTRFEKIIPDAFRARDAIRRRDMARNAANTTLKELFGGQLSDAEREAAAKEYYNDALDNKTNAMILRDKIDQLKRGLEAETAKAQYYERNRTLKGFNFDSIVGSGQQRTAPTDYSQMSDDQLLELYRKAGGR